ncbi:MAG: DNA cytosine methyltransferase [Bradymonadia bacterium]
MTDRTYNVLHVFCGAGGGGLGFKRASATFRGIKARFQCIGALDADPRAVADYSIVTDGDRATVADLFTREDYELFHGHPPPESWRELTPSDLVQITGGRRPDVVFGSPPCKGLSGLLSKKMADTQRYQALNRLVTRWLFLVLEAWRDDPPGLLLLENVPRIAQRGAEMLNTVRGLLSSYGYAVHEGTHDCGELGALGQSRKRFLLVARRVDRVSAILFEPPRQALRSISDIISHLPTPGAGGGAMHVLPKLASKTWIRLALVRAGKDWRDLAKRWAPGRWHLRQIGPAQWRLVEGCGPGIPIKDPAAGPWHSCVLGVRTMGEACGTVTGGAAPTTGAFSVADPRLGCSPSGATLRVRPVDGPSPTVVACCDVWSSGGFGVADPRLKGVRHNNVFRVQGAGDTSRTVTGGGLPTSGGLCVADPLLGCAPRNGTMGVQDWAKSGATVTAALDVHSGPGAVSDPRATFEACDLPIIISDDGCWHRPLTTLELAALQGFPVDRPGGLVLSGKSATWWRTAIGNAVPPPTAQAIAEEMLRTLLVSEEGAFVLSGDGGVWVNGYKQQTMELVR